MHYAFEDKDNLFLIIDLMSGGDLRYHIGKYRRFTEEQTSKWAPDINLFASRILRGVHVTESGVPAQELHPA